MDICDGEGNKGEIAGKDTLGVEDKKLRMGVCDDGEGTAADFAGKDRRFNGRGFKALLNISFVVETESLSCFVSVT